MYFMFTLLIPPVYLWIVVYRLVDKKKKEKKKRKKGVLFTEAVCCLVRSFYSQWLFVAWSGVFLCFSSCEEH